MLENDVWPAQLWELWAKTGRDFMWLALPQHMIDSAQIAQLLWKEWVAPGAIQRLGLQLQLETPDLAALVAWLAGSHDAGKCEPSFVLLAEQRPGNTHLIDRARGAGFDFPKILVGEP